MNTFYKNLSIYGILPVAGKFIGFFLVPVYAHLFSAEEFGEVELVISYVNLLVYFINLEFYSSVGRYIFGFKKESDRRSLVSTGLWMTAFTTIFVLALLAVAREHLIEYCFGGRDMMSLYIAGFIWLALDGFSTYLSVIPRYTNKPKLYVAVNSGALLARVLSTIFFVLVAKTGIIGIIYGHICGTALSIILNSIISRSLLGLKFSFRFAKIIASYAIPMVPGTLLAALWIPMLFGATEEFVSMVALGVLGFALRITSVITMFRSALMNAWQPMIYEHIEEKQFASSIKHNCFSVSVILLSLGSFLSLFAKEIIVVLGSESFLSAYVFIPFLCLSGYLQSMIQMRGFGPLISGKTYLKSIYVIIATILSFWIMAWSGPRIGIYGIGISIIVYDIVQYLLLSIDTYSYMRKSHSESIVIKWEYVYLLLFAVCAMLCLFDVHILLRAAVAIVVAIWVVLANKNLIIKFLKRSR